MQFINTASDVTERMALSAEMKVRQEKEQQLMQEQKVSNAALGDMNKELEAIHIQLVFSSSMLIEKQGHIRDILEQAPVGICLLSGAEHIITIANPTIRRIWGRAEAELIGKPHKIALPELAG